MSEPNGTARGDPNCQGARSHKLKVAFVCQLYVPHRGGVERYVEALATRLCSSHEISVLTTDPTGKLPESEEIQGVQVKRFKSWAPNESIYLSITLRKYLRQNSNQYDIVHANNYHALPAYYAANSKKSNVLVFTPHFHGTIGHTVFRTLLHIPYRILGRRIFERADRVICCTEFEKRIILESFNVSESELVMIKEGINVVQTEPTQRDRKIILCVSRLEKYKGIQQIIRALPLLPSYSLIVVGSGPYASSLHNQIQSMRLQERAVIRSNVSQRELNEIYSQADVAVLLSEHEQYSYFIGEALSAKIPCVVANRAALREWVDGETCVGIDDPSDPSVVAKAISSMTGRKFIRPVPTWDDYVARLTKVYEDVLCR